MDALKIHELKFNKREVDKLSSTSYKNFPIVYILRGENNVKQKVYIGQSVQVRNRLNNHLTDKQKKQLDQAMVIEHNQFNQSATYNIETKLINYFIADQKYEIINKSQITQSLTHNYYQKNMYDRNIFEEIWKELLRRKIVNSSVIDIENRDIYKLSPYKELTESQMELKQKILDFCETNINKKEQSVFFIQGEAGTGKSVILSSILNTLQDLTKDDSSNLYDSENYLLVNNTEMIKVYKNISESLPNLLKKNFQKPTTFINDSKKGRLDADITLVDEAHLLLSRSDPYNSFYEDNHLKEIIDNSKITIIVFDENQFLKLKSYWSSEMIKNLTQTLNTEYYELTDQFRMKANVDTYRWIHDFANYKRINDFPKIDENYELKIFEDANDMYNAIEEKNEEVELSRVLSTFDYEHKKDGTDYFVQEPNFKLPWNRDYRNSTWAEKDQTIHEVGSIYTIQGFDLNYAGVILGPSISYDEEKEEMYIITQNYQDSEAFKTTSKSKPQYNLTDAKENIILNSLNILMKRGIKGLFIYASDNKLRKALLENQRGVKNEGFN